MAISKFNVRNYIVRHKFAHVKKFDCFSADVFKLRDSFFKADFSWTPRFKKLKDHIWPKKMFQRITGKSYKTT